MHQDENEYDRDSEFSDDVNSDETYSIFDSLLAMTKRYGNQVNDCTLNQIFVRTVVMVVRVARVPNPNKKILIHRYCRMIYLRQHMS